MNVLKLSKPTLAITFLLWIGLVLNGGCSRHAKFEGALVKSYEEASSVVGTYGQKNLTESQFLMDWPLIGEQVHRDELAWGIVDVSASKTGGTVTRSYWLGYFESKLIPRTREAGESYTVTDTSGTRFSVPAPKETIVEQQWTKHGVWRLDFEDSVLVSSKKVIDY